MTINSRPVLDPLLVFAGIGCIFVAVITFITDMAKPPGPLADIALLHLVAGLIALKVRKL
jgi:hypothetical protein